MYESYRTVHDLPGLVTSSPIPASGSDFTAVPPKLNEVRFDGSTIYVCTDAATPKWSSVALTTMTAAQATATPSSKKTKNKTPKKTKDKEVEKASSPSK